jgi:hypothetical protein
MLFSLRRVIASQHHRETIYKARRKRRIFAKKEVEGEREE